MKTSSGFTLIELMIVIAIIGLLAAAAIPAYTDYLKKGKVFEAMELLGSLKKPIEEYFASKGYYPSSITVLTDETGGKYTENMTITGGGPGSSSITVTSKFKLDDSVLKDYVFALCFKQSPAPGQWYCDARHCPENTVPPKYLPTTCK